MVNITLANYNQLLNESTFLTPKSSQQDYNKAFEYVANETIKQVTQNIHFLLILSWILGFIAIVCFTFYIFGFKYAKLCFFIGYVITFITCTICGMMVFMSYSAVG